MYVIRRFCWVALIAATLGTLVPQDAVAAGTNVVRGQLIKIDASVHQVTVRPTSGADVTLAVTAGSQLKSGGKLATLARFNVGQRVRATYAEKNGVNEIVVLKPAVTTDEQLRKEINQALTTAKQYTFQQKDKYEAKLHETLNDVDDRIDHLEAEAKTAGTEAKARIRTHIAELKKHRTVLGERLEKAKSATADAWDNIKAGVGAAGTDLQKSLGELFKD
jgi:hypothetical protein